MHPPTPAPPCYAGAVAANAAALGAVRGVAAVGRLATPLVMALLKTLALSRLFS